MKIYEITRYECTDENAIKDFKIVRALRDTNPEAYKISYQNLCSAFRETLNVKNLISLGYSEELNKIRVILYNKEVSVDDFYSICFDEEKFYFEIEECTENTCILCKGTGKYTSL